MRLTALPKSALALYGAAVACGLAAAALALGALGFSRTLVAGGSERAERVRGEGGRVRLGAQVIDTSPGAARASLEAATRAVLTRRLRVRLPGEGESFVVPEAIGFSFDEDRASALASELERVTSPLRASLESSGAPVEAPVSFRSEGLEAKLLELKNAVDRRPKSARIDTKSGQVKGDVVGLRFDVFRTMEAVVRAVRSGADEAIAVAEEVPAIHRARDLENVRFDEVLGYFDTHYNSDAKHEARSFNLKLAASRFDGTVLFPGETFDFNEVVGPRTEAWGYKVAPVIASGELVDGVGGGTCQIAGTLHGAAFFAGLDIVERHPHTRPSYYIKMGLDAAVAYPTLTLRIRNPFAFPVVLVESVRGGVVRAEILGPKRTQSVTFVRKIDEATRFDVREAPEPRLPRGERIVSQRGVPGFKVTRFRIVREGAFAYRERLSDLYPPTSEVVRVGTGTEPPDPALHDDDHPEYVADDYLSVTQGPDIRTPNVTEPERGGGTTEVRVAGRYGMKGWSSKSGAFDRRRKKAAELLPAQPRKGAAGKAPKGGKAAR
jgi:vancomycin resistance protein YoaR